MVKAFLVKLQDTSGSAGADAEFHQHSGLAQSALMCIDVLARFLGKRLDWSSILTETLQEIVNLCSVLAALTNATVSSSDASAASAAKSKAKKVAGISAVALQAEYMKLFGSAALCTATLSSVLGAAALTLLPVRLTKAELSLVYYLDFISLSVFNTDNNVSELVLSRAPC